MMKVQPDEKQNDKLILARRLRNRQIKLDRTLAQIRKPDRDIILEGEINDEYDYAVSNQITELRAILAQDNIILPQKTLEDALKYPSFDWNKTLCGEPKFADAGVSLMHNPWPKKKKAAKGKTRKGGSPKKRATSK